MAPQYPGRFCARSFLPERLDLSRRPTSTRISKSLPELQKPSVVSKQTEQRIVGTGPAEDEFWVLIPQDLEGAHEESPPPPPIPGWLFFRADAFL